MGKHRRPSSRSGSKPRGGTRSRKLSRTRCSRSVHKGSERMLSTSDVLRRAIKDPLRASIIIFLVETVESIKRWWHPISKRLTAFRVLSRRHITKLTASSKLVYQWFNDQVGG